MLARVHSGALIGIDVYPVEVEVDVYSGMPSIAVVGLPDSAVKESTARVKSAIINSGYPFPSRRITINLAPADLCKEGSGFELPIAPGSLTALDLLPHDKLESSPLLGEHPVDFSRTRGQEHAKRAVEVAAAGGHNVLALCPQLMLGFRYVEDFVSASDESES